MAYTAEEWKAQLTSSRGILLDVFNSVDGYFATQAIPVGGDESMAVTLDAGQISANATAFESRVQIVIDTLTAGFAA